MTRRRHDGSDVRQFQIDWNPAKARKNVEPSATDPHPVLRLRWDFKSCFPQPLPDAVDAGVMAAEDTMPQGIEAIHREHSRKMLGTLADLDAVMDRQRRSLPVRSAEGLSVPTRLQRWYTSLLGIYEEWFGKEAADAFDKAVRAWHARIEVVIDKDQQDDLMTAGTSALSAAPESPPVIDAEVVEPKPAATRMLPAPPPKRIVARLPVPRPLPIAIVEAHFGVNEEGQPIHPTPDEVREITNAHADKLIQLLDDSCAATSFDKEQLLSQYHQGIAAYEQSFGERSARQLEAYVQRQTEPGTDRWRNRISIPGAGR